MAAQAIEAPAEAQETPIDAIEAVVLPWQREGASYGDLSENDRAVTLQQAQIGNLEAVQFVFRSLLDNPTKGREMLDLPRRVRQELIIATYGERNDLARRSYLAKADMVEASLCTEASASPLEHLLIQRVVTCWLAAELADIDASAQEEHHNPRVGVYGSADYYARRQDRAHRRFLQAVEALNRMRRLMSPFPLAAGQVNVAAPGAQQVNVASLR